MTLYVVRDIETQDAVGLYWLKSTPTSDNDDQSIVPIAARSELMAAPLARFGSP